MRDTKTKFLTFLFLAAVLIFTLSQRSHFVDNSRVASEFTEDNIDAGAIGVYFWAGRLNQSAGSLIASGERLLEDTGTANIRIAMSSKADLDYGLGGCIGNFTLSGLARRQDFNAVLSNSHFKTIMITAYDGTSFPDCATKNYLNPAFYNEQNIARIKAEYEEFARYLTNFPDKTFIISHWEGDNDIFCGSAYGATRATCPNYESAMNALTAWLLVRTEGLRQAGAANVFSAAEFNIVRWLDSAGLMSMLYNVLPSLDVDYFSYSAYESTNTLYSDDGGLQLRQDLDLIREVIARGGHNPDRLIIGEVGFDQASREQNRQYLAEALGIFGQYRIPYIFVWNLLDSGGSFGLYDVNENMTAVGTYLCEVWNGTDCGPAFMISNITVPARNPRFWNVDSWRLELRGASPQSEVALCAEKDGAAFGCTAASDLGFAAEGTTDGAGSWFLENSWAGFDNQALNGRWREWAEVAGSRSQAIRFRIVSPDIIIPSSEKLYIPDSERVVDTARGEEKLAAEGGTPPYLWEVERGELPEGVSLTSDGTISQNFLKTIARSNWFVKKVSAQETQGVGVGVTDQRGRRAVADIAFLGIAQAQAQTTGFHLVPCGRSDQQPPQGADAKNYPNAQCKFEHLIILIVRVINYLISVAALVAMYQIVFAGFDMVLSQSNPEKLEKGKKAVSNAVVGFGIIIFAFIFINLVVNAVLGKEGATRQWWDVACIYDPGKAGCPFKP